MDGLLLFLGFLTRMASENGLSGALSLRNAINIADDCCLISA